MSLDLISQMSDAIVVVRSIGLRLVKLLLGIGEAFPTAGHLVYRRKVICSERNQSTVTRRNLSGTHVGDALL